MRLKHHVWQSIVVLFLCLSSVEAQDLRIVSYNLDGRPRNSSEQTSLETILGAIGNKSVFGTVSQVDLMAFQEGPSDSDLLRIEAAFENTFGGDYAIVATDVDGENTRTGFVYNTAVLTLEESFAMEFGFDHAQMVARFSHVAAGNDNEFWIYSCHFTEGDTPEDITNRTFDALAVSETYNQLALFGKNYLWAGTFGIQGNEEDAYSYVHAFDHYDTELLNELDLRAIWSNNNAYLPFHTSEPTGAFGGLSERNDFFSVSRWLIDDSGMEFVQGSTTILGNNGSHDLFGGVDTGDADLVVQSALAGFSNHLPVFSDFKFNQIDQPVNDFYVGFATESFIVQPAGPRTDAGGIEFFNIEGDGNGAFASFGVLDFDLTDELNDKETIFHSEKLEIVLSQANAGFSQNGAYRVYLCTPAAANVAIDQTITYQAGNNGLDSVPTILATGAKPLRTYPGIHRYPDGSTVEYRSSVLFRLYGPEINPAFMDAVQNNGKLRLLIVPLTDSTAATFAGVGHLGTATPPRYFADSDIEAVFNPATLTFENGLLWSGTVESLADSDNVKLSARTNSSIEIIAEGATRSFPLQKFEFTFEASVRSSTPINQKVELFNFNTQEWVVVDERRANVLGDRSITVQPPEPYFHYRDDSFPSTVRARITFTRQGLARGIQAFIDHAEWRIR